MRKIVFILAAVAALAACSKTQTSINVGPQGQKALALRGITGIPTRSAVTGTTFPEGYAMRLSAWHNAGVNSGATQSSNYFDGIKFTKNDDGVWAEAKYWPIDPTSSLDFLAYACAGIADASKGVVPTAVWGDTVARKVTLTVPGVWRTFDDILYGSANNQFYVETGNPVLFRHAESAVVFALKSSVEYDETLNKGITVSSISVDTVQWAGTLTVLNPAAAGGTGDVSAVWSLQDTVKDHVNVRVSSGNTGMDPAEPELADLILTDEFIDLDDNPLGEGYAIFPEQTASRSFTIRYVLHNGFKSDGTTPLNNELEYVYKCTDTWKAGIKYIYKIEINLKEITVAPSVQDWNDPVPPVDDIVL